MNAVEARDGGVILRVRVQPKASRDAVLLDADGRIRVALTAPPVEGAANKALCQYVAKTLGLPKRAVCLVSGEKSREKAVRIEGLSAEDIQLRLFGAPGGQRAK